ncbi:MAG: MFS transporter, partial [Halanaerobiales bacterium]
MNLNRNNKKMMYGIFVWHGFFLALTMSMIDFNTVLPSLINNLMESKIIFGSLYSILLGAPKLFNIIFSHYLESYKYKKKFLMLGIYLRAFSFLGMAVTTYFFAPRSPVLVVVSFYIWVALFALSGGFAGLSYSEIIAKLVVRPDRGRLFAFKEFASSVAAFTGGLIVSRIFRMENLPFPSNYALNFVIGFSGLIVAAFAFWMIDEPPSQVESEDRIPPGEFFAKVINILNKDRRFSNFIVVENLSSFSLMVLPFYMLYARDIFGVGEAYIGKYLLFQITGKVSSNLIWGYIADRLSSR